MEDLDDELNGSFFVIVFDYFEDMAKFLLNRCCSVVEIWCFLIDDCSLL